MNAILLKLLVSVLARSTPALVDYLRGMAVEFRVKAAQTDNPVDDVLADLLCALVGED